MGKKKSETKTTQQQAFNTQQSGSTSIPDTPDIGAYRDWRPQTDPGLAAQYGNARNQLTSSFNNPLGGYGTAQTREAQQRTALRNLNQDEAQAFRSGTYDVNAQRGGQLGMLASLTRGTQSSGTSSGTGTGSGTQTTVQSGDLLGQLLGAGAQVGSAALLGKKR